MNKNQITDPIPDKGLKFVHQFLIEHNFENTADALMIEAAIKGLPYFEKHAKTKDETYESYQTQVMLSYKTGDWRTFFQLWSLLISDDAKQTKAYKVLMLYLYVYFAMLPKRTLISYWCKAKEKVQLSEDNSVIPTNGSNVECNENFMTEIEKEMNESMEQLRKFLSTTGKELENDAELQSYFALPFTEDPYAEPSLRKIFHATWTDQLTESLQVFLNKYKAETFICARHDNESLNSFSANSASLPKEQRGNMVENKTQKSNNVPIVPNDRNIPIFLEEDSEVQCNLHNNAKYKQKSKSIQTVSVNTSEEEIYSLHFAKGNEKLNQCSKELAITKSHLCSVHFNYEKLKRRFHKLHADYHKLMSIARVLTTALENSARGEVVDFQAMLEICIQIFPNLFNQNIKDGSQCPSEVLLQKSLSDMKVINSETYNFTIPPKLLDIKKIKTHLIDGSIKIKLFLLQALRRKITFSQPSERDETVHEYISKDLLGLHSQIASYKGKSILPYLLIPQDAIIPHPLQQSIARLLNTLASFRCGRDYLSFDSTVVDMVFQCLTRTDDNNIDALTCNMIIAMLQKLSLRKQQRIYMIENGLVEWLIYHLHVQYHTMDSYRLEYATALLMNLSLHQAARKRASTMAPLLISTLTELLLMDYTSILPYINGALNNFLTNPIINEEAGKTKFASIIEQCSKRKSGEIREHLEHILKIHRREITVTVKDEDMTDNNNEEYDILESQLEENDPVKNNYGELYGESLLKTCYTTVPGGMREKEFISDTSSSEQFNVDAAESVVRSNQIKSLPSTYKMIPREGNLSRKFVNKNQHTRSKNNSLELQAFVTVFREEGLSRRLISSQHFIKGNDNNLVLKEFETAPREKNYSRKILNQKREVKRRDNNVALQNYTERPTIHLEAQACMTKLNPTPIKARPLYRHQTTNETWNVNDTRLTLKDVHDESATYIYENQTSKESSKTTVASSAMLAIGSEAESTVMEKLSSIASLNIRGSDELDNANITLVEGVENNAEDVFSTKPKLLRTPP